MAMTLRLTEEETEALRATAEAEGRSMHEVARTAIKNYVTSRDEQMHEMFAMLATRDAEILKRLGS